MSSEDKPTITPNSGNEILEVILSPVGEETAEMVMAALSVIGYEGFIQGDQELKGYIPAALYDDISLKEILNRFSELVDIAVAIETLPDINWNAEWEKHYQPVLISGRCMVRAPFHELPGTLLTQQSFHPEGMRDVEKHGFIDLSIEPKMSFGTAHHETTALMIEGLLEEDLEGKRVLDMGCGTGVLAILAKKLGAATVVAIDNDRWAIDNTRENLLRNNVSDISVILGDAPDIPVCSFDMIMANINRNILMEQLPAYASAFTEKGGALWISGFLQQDLDELALVAKELGFRLIDSGKKNEWMIAKFQK